MSDEQVLLQLSEMSKQIAEFNQQRKTLSKQLTSIDFQLKQLISQHQSEAIIPSQWLRPKVAAEVWQISDSTLRKYRTREWQDGSYNWMKGIHWKRGFYNRAIIDHWFTYRYDHQTHQDYIRRWLKASNELPAHLQKRNKGRRR